jgi:hypothetical protein
MERNIFADMDFLERGSLPECMQPDEKKITRKEFQAAVSAASDYIVNDPEVEGMAKFMFPLTGMMFAAKMEEILFGKEEG